MRAAARAFILDLDQLGRDGMTVARRLRRIHPDRPLVLLTAAAKRAEAARRAGFPAVLGKPFSREELAAVLALF